MKLTTLLLSALLLASCGNRIAYYDSRKVFEGHPSLKTIEEQKKKLVDKIQLDFKDLTDKKAAQTKVLESVSDAKQRDSIKNELTALENEISTYTVRAQKEFDEQAAELEKPLLKKLDKAVSDVANEKHLDIVLNVAQIKTEHSHFGKGADVTETIKKRLN